MNPKHSASRRKFLVSTPGAIGGVTGLSAVNAVTVAGCATAHRIDRQLVFGSLADASKELDRLAKGADLRLGSDWNWPQTLVHCAQSIEYSLTGFPQMKSAIFQRTIGAAAFSVFSWRGRMTHDLAEPIPGAPELDPKAEVTAALTRVRSAIVAFYAHTTSLRPHFAYGELTKTEYERAHAMHLANHFSTFDIVT